MPGLFKKSPDDPSTSWFQRLKTGLKNTGLRIGDLFVGRKIDAALFEELETALLQADTGVTATRQLMLSLRERAASKRLQSAEQLKTELLEVLVDMISPLETVVDFSGPHPFVIMWSGKNDLYRENHTYGAGAWIERNARCRRHFSGRGARAAGGLG